MSPSRSAPRICSPSSGSFSNTALLNTLLERAGNLIRLTPRERHLLLRAWWRFLVVHLALPLVSLTRLLPRGPAPGTPTPSLSADRIGWLVTVAGRYAPGRTTCLTQAVVLAWILHREGIEATLRIGVARRADDLVAHAWLEHDGRVVFGLPDEQTYHPLLPTGPGPRAP